MLPSLVIPTVCVLIGLRLIKGSGKKAPVYNVPDGNPSAKGFAVNSGA